MTGHRSCHLQRTAKKNDETTQSLNPFPAEPPEPFMAIRKIGQILIDSGFLDEDQLELLLSEQERVPDQLLGKIGLEMGLISEEQLAQALAEQLNMQVVTIGENGITVDDILVHDQTNRAMAFLLAAMEPPSFPIALGVLYCDTTVGSFEAAIHAQVDQAKQQRKADLAALMRKGHTWVVE